MQRGVGKFKKHDKERKQTRENEKEIEKENRMTRRRRWMKKRHDDGPGIESVSNLQSRRGPS